MEPNQRHLDVGRLRAEAERLDGLLAEAAPRSEVLKGLHIALRPFLDDARSGTITEPVDSIPGSYPFSEGMLKDYPEVELSYVSFKYLISARQHYLDNP